MTNFLRVKGATGFTGMVHIMTSSRTDLKRFVSSVKIKRDIP
jgi:hypothetical protein